jgi:RNA polymerase sigma factor for flagellar operon FliA
MGPNTERAVRPGVFSVDPKRDRLTAKLWRGWRRAPSDELRNALVEAYQHLVHDMVRRLAVRLPRSVDRGDLETAANVGLMSAITSFDPRRGVRFESYCELRIRGALLDELRTQDWLPRPWRTRVERQKRAHEQVRAEKKAEPSDEEVAAAMSLSPEEYRQLFGIGLLGARTGFMPKGGQVGQEAQSLDVVPDANADEPDEKLTRDELLRLVAQRLTEQEYRIVYLKYWEDLPMREIGQLEGLSESRVCKIHLRILERLKDRFGVSAE